MSKKNAIPTEVELIQAIEARTPPIPGCRSIQHTVIKCGPQKFKTASVLQFGNDDDTKEAHQELRLYTYSRRAGGGFDFEGKPITWSCRDAEIEAAYSRHRYSLENS